MTLPHLLERCDSAAVCIGLINPNGVSDVTQRIAVVLHQPGPVLRQG